MTITYSTLTTPTLVSPTSGGTGYTITPNFDWNTSTGGTSPYTYEIMVADNLSFTSPDINATGISDTNYSYTTGLTPNTVYYWKVRALDSGSAYSDWATTQSFTTDTFDAPSITTPTNAGSITDTTPSVGWSASSGGSGTYTYELMIDDSSGFATPNVNATAIATTSYTTTTDLPLGTYYAKVRAKDSLNNYTSWSSTISFNIVSGGGGGGASTPVVTTNQEPVYNPPATLTATPNDTPSDTALDDIIDTIMEPVEYTIDQVGEFFGYMFGLVGLSNVGSVLGTNLSINTPFGIISLPYWAIGLAIVVTGFMMINGGGKKKKRKNTFIKRINRTVNKWV